MRYSREQVYQRDKERLEKILKHFPSWFSATQAHTLGIISTPKTNQLYNLDNRLKRDKHTHVLGVKHLPNNSVRFLAIHNPNQYDLKHSAT